MRMSMIMEIFKTKSNNKDFIKNYSYIKIIFALRNFFLSLSRTFIQYTSLETLNSSLVVGTLV